MVEQISQHQTFNGNVQLHSSAKKMYELRQYDLKSHQMSSLERGSIPIRKLAFHGTPQSQGSLLLFP
jgi:hypothetical protein